MTLTVDEIAAIQESKVISSNPSDINKLLQVNNPAFVSRFGPGDEICRVGDRADRMWVIVEGSLEIYGQVNDEAVRLPVTRARGEIVGEQGILDNDGTRKATVRSSTFTKVVVIPRDAIFSLNDQQLQAQVFLNLARIMSGKLTQATGHRSRAIGVNQQTREVLNRFTTEFSRRNVESYLRGEDPFRSIEAVFWFSDLVGFSTLADTLEPSNSAALIRSVMELQTIAITKRGGFVDKFMGDGLMAFWPKIDSWRDTSENALRAALVFKSGLPLVDLPKEASQIDIRIGLHSGKAIYGNFGADGLISQTFLGTDVNRAARCEQAKHDIDGNSLTHFRIRATDTFRRRLEKNSQAELQAQTIAKVKHDETFTMWCR